MAPAQGLGCFSPTGLTFSAGPTLAPRVQGLLTCGDVCDRVTCAVGNTCKVQVRFQASLPGPFKCLNGPGSRGPPGICAASLAAVGQSQSTEKLCGWAK